MELITYPIFKKTTGEVVKRVSLPSGANFKEILFNCETDEDFFDNSCPHGLFRSSESQYFVDGEVVERPLLSTATWDKVSIKAGGFDSAILAGLPIGSIVIVKQGKMYFKQVINDGVFELSCEDAGKYFVEVYSFPYQKYTQVIEVI